MTINYIEKIAQLQFLKKSWATKHYRPATILISNLNSKGINQRVNIRSMVKLSQLFCFVCEFIQILREFPEQMCPAKRADICLSHSKIFKNEVKIHRDLQQQKTCKILILRQDLFHACLSDSAQFCLPSRFYICWGHASWCYHRAERAKCGSHSSICFCFETSNYGMVCKLCLRQETVEGCSSNPHRIRFHLSFQCNFLLEKTSIIHFFHKMEDIDVVVEREAQNALCLTTQLH